VSKIVILGIDALDAALLRRWKGDLPNFSRIMDEGYFAPLESTMPPDSIPAWVTIYTGMQPWEHGVVDSVDYLDIKQGAQAVDTGILRGKTFWDRAGEAGKRVCVLNPLLAYPVWPVNGIMANGPVFVTGEAQTFPEEIGRNMSLPELGGMVDFPGRKDLAAFLERTAKVTGDQAAFGLELLAREEWDVFFLCLLTLDRVMHFLWRYTDPEDPTYPGRNPFQDSVKDFFILLDSIVGGFMDRLSPRQRLLIVSDHGHSRRPTEALYINEMLRRDGLLRTPQGRVPGMSPVALIEKTKTAFLRMMHRLDLEDWVYKIASVIPKAKRKSLKSSSYAVVRESSLAWLSDTGGGTSFGGIDINRRLCEDQGQDYEALRERVIGLLTPLTDKDGERIVRFARRREDVFTGRNVSRYPDVVFELREDYGVDRALFSGLVGKSSTHRKVSGGHSKFGTLMLWGADVPHPGENPHISQVYATIMRIIGLG
jgi:predicted AlkP superfamily phosphohydrolase/phosphomutase